MYNIEKVKNYRQFAELLKEKTDCDIRVKLMNDDGSHIHYQFNDEFGVSIGVLCVDNGYASFAPFETLESAHNNQYINVIYLASAEEFIRIISILGKIFIEDADKQI